MPVKTNETIKKQIMKKFLLTLAAVAMSLGTAFAQLPAGSTAPDFTITDTDGNTHNLYDILDEGTPVILDLFAVWCGPCWSYAETGVLEEVNSVYGPEGSNEVFVITVESDPDTPASQLYGGGSSIGDWTSIIDFPLADDAGASIANDYDLAYYPTIYMICPDRKVTEVGQLSSAAAYYDAFSNCSVAVEGVNAGVATYDSDVIACSGSKIEPVVSIQNLGTETLTACTINTLIDGQIVSSFDWTGSLNTYATSSVTLAELPAFDSNTEVTFTTVLTGDVNAGDDAITVEISTPVSSHASINIEVSTDFYPGETSWEIRDVNGSVVMSGSYEPGTEDQWNGGGPDADMTHNHVESLAIGCYTFVGMDAFGDGQTGYSGSGAGTDGSIVVTDADGTELLNVSGNWGELIEAAFEVTYGVGIEEVLANKLSIFPNPASNNAAIELNLVESNEVVIEVVNTLGQKVFTYASTMSAGLNKVELPVATLNAGLFYVNIKVGNELITEKLNILK
ncbi:MAG: thiol-disulfide isomerase/thioredoxin [Flavobacteriales bacterium]